MVEALNQLDLFFQSEGKVLATILLTVFRFATPFLALVILWRSALPLIRFRREPEVWAWLVMPDGQQLPVTHWENIIGRARGSDIIVRFQTVSRNHAVLTRYEDGSWSITDIGSKGTVYVNRKKVLAAPVKYGDIISLGGLEMKLVPVTAEELEEQTDSRTKPAQVKRPGFTLLILTVLQVMILFRFFVTGAMEDSVRILPCFGILIGVQWVVFFMVKLMGRSSFEVENIAFFLSTVGLCVIASSNPSGMSKQLICILVGIVIYFVICWSLRDLNRAKKFRYFAAIGGVLLLMLNLILAPEINGARNWIFIGSMSFQPSELLKLCFIYVGTSTMDRIVAKRNVISFIAYTGMICISLAYFNDFGGVLIFFVTLLCICCLRSGTFSALWLIGAVVCCAIVAVMVIDIPPHIIRRFSTWGHAWDDPYNTGYSQTNAMMCMASGGVFGVGCGEGWLKFVEAGDTDLVFGFVCEEWGLIMGIICVLAIVVLGMFVFRSCAVGRSSFYTIGACAAATVLLTPTILNVFGTMDLLPLTGVAFPFVSNGGSSMLCSWGLIAFIKAADTRQNASFAVRTVHPEEVNKAYE